MKKDINYEVNRLLKIQKELEKLEILQNDCNHFVFLSQDKYDKLSEQVKMSNLVFWIIPEDTVEYFNEDLVLFENDTIFIVRNNECVNTVKTTK